MMRAFHSLLAGIIMLALTGIGPQTIHAQAPGNQPDPAQVSPDPWPKSAQVNGVTYTLYQPQLESWDGYNLVGHAAVSVQPAGAKSPTFGAFNISAVTLVDRETRTVQFQNIQVQKANFPSAPAQAAQYQTALQSILANGPANMSLDRLQAALAVLGAEKQGQAVSVMNPPPNFVFSQTAAVLVSIDGQPVWSKVPKTPLERCLNTRALILREKNNLYVHLFDGYMEAENLSGPWTVAKKAPRDADKVAQELASQKVVDLMTGPANQKDPGQKPSLKTGAPVVYVETVPTELIVIEGAPSWVPITGTNLLYVNNTTANIVQDLDDQQTYVLVTGRWFRGPGFTGPWQYVSGKDLPADFAKIPDDSAKENMKASVPGTPQAQEAIIAASIPQTATVTRANVNFTPQISGSPELNPIPNTTLNYVFNAADPIIEVSPSEWFAVHNGVWFNATSVQGPWLVASSVPSVIYSIPPSSPLYYVTYVKVYASTPQAVAVGYTPGYMGTVVSADGVVVYGTGYTYQAYISPTVYYPAPVTYGYATNMTWTPWLGWAFGFGMGWAWGAASVGWGGAWGWGCAPYWGAYGGYYGAYGAAYGYHGGAAVWGPGGWAGTTGNVYRQYGATGVVSRTSGGYNAWTGNAWSSQVGRSYNSVTGQMSAGQRGAVQNVYTGNSAYGARGATYNPTTGVGAAGGRATFNNAATGQSTTVGRGVVTGPAGGTTRVAQVNNNYYADHNGNVYRGNSSTGSFQKYDAGGGWNDVDRDQAQSLQSHNSSRQMGDARSASSSWGGNWSGWRGGGGGSAGGSAGRSWGGGGWGGGRFGGGGGFGGGGFGGFRGGGGFGGRR